MLELALFKKSFFLNIYFKSYKNKKKNTTYINDTAGSMLCHIRPAAYTYTGSFTLYATPLKGREMHLKSVIGIAKPAWGHANGETMTEG